MTNTKTKISMFGAALLALATTQSWAAWPVSHTNGILPVTCVAGKTTYVSIPFTREPADYGTATTVTATSVSDSSANYTLTGAHSLQVLSGSNRGRTIDITSFAGSQINLAEDPTSFISVGDEFIIVPNWTFDTIFGNPGASGNPSGILGGASASVADNIILLNAAGSFDTYFYKNAGAGGTGWRKVGQPVNADKGTTKLPLQDGIQVVRRASGGNLTLDLKGVVRTGRQSNVIKPAQTGVHTGNNVITFSNTEGGLTFKSSNLAADLGVGITGVKGGLSSTSADNIKIQDASGNTLVYYYKNGGAGGTGWRRTDKPLNDNRELDQIIPGTAAFIVRRSTAPTFTYQQNQTFTP
jgi:uncharacterized protein (TIGR02597 family)